MRSEGKGMEEKGSDQAKRGYHRCSQFRECNQKDCMFFEGEGNCWTLVSPFKMRRRPSLLLKDTAERCACLSAPCVECTCFEP